jgi:hypothetical protein
MKNLLNEIKKVEFKVKQNFDFNLNKEFELISHRLNLKEKELLNSDFQYFLNKGKFVVINTFVGGILFLKVFEQIEKITIDYQTEKNDFNASVIFESDSRKVENIKYRPKAGKVQSIEWKDIAIFPNFFKYEKEIQIVLLTIIGKIVKWICEYGRTNFAYMKIENEFNIELLIDEQIETNLKVELN